MLRRALLYALEDMRVLVAVATAGWALGGCAELPKSHLPDGFVYLRDVDPSIVESVRYASQDNFMSRPVVGYEAPRIVLTRQAAQAIKKVQAELRTRGLSLIVYDGYRPQCAVDAFCAWGKDPRDDAGKMFYYPTITKKEIFAREMIATKSSHSRGSTLDLSLISLGGYLMEPPRIETRFLNDKTEIPYLHDGSIDMGGSFDLFHEASSHDSPLVSKTAQTHRVFLKKLMERHGFVAHPQEWWHYTLKNEPYPKTYFNFAIR